METFLAFKFAKEGINYHHHDHPVWNYLTLVNPKIADVFEIRYFRVEFSLHVLE